MFNMHVFAVVRHRSVISFSHIQWISAATAQTCYMAMPWPTVELNLNCFICLPVVAGQFLLNNFSTE